MNCPRCRALIVAEDVNLEHLLAKCRGCQEVFRFDPQEIEAVTERVKEHEAEADKPRERTREDDDRDLDIRSIAVKAPRPDNIDVEDWGPNRRLVKRWFTLSVIGMAFFCVFWDGFLILWYSMAFFGDAPLIMVLFPLLHLAAGVAITYSTIAAFVNRTVITVSEDALEVWHGPMPWLGNMKLPIANIEQLYCTQATRTWGNRNNYYATPMVAVNALLANGSTKIVVNSLPRDEGLFIEQQLEEWLDITPKRVPGQVD